MKQLSQLQFYTWEKLDSKYKWLVPDNRAGKWKMELGWSPVFWGQIQISFQLLPLPLPSGQMPILDLLLVVQAGQWSPLSPILLLSNHSLHLHQKSKQEDHKLALIFRRQQLSVASNGWPTGLKGSELSVINDVWEDIGWLFGKDVVEEIPDLKLKRSLRSLPNLRAEDSVLTQAGWAKSQAVE